MWLHCAHVYQCRTSATARNKSMHASQGEACLALPTQDIQMVNEMTVWLIVQRVNLGVKT